MNNNNKGSKSRLTSSPLKSSLTMSTELNKDRTRFLSNLSVPIFAKTLQNVRSNSGKKIDEKITKIIQKCTNK